MSGYMSIVERCLRVVNNSPDGVTWTRLNERVDLLAKASKREKTQVFQHLKGKKNLWNNNADDMSDTMFMLVVDAPADAVAETSTTPVSATATAKKARLNKYSSLHVNKTMGLEPVAFSNPQPKVVNMPGVNPAAEVVNHPTLERSDIFAYNSFYTEDEVIAEMAYHVAQSAGHGLTLTALRMSVPEFSECDDDDRFHLVNKMRNRYGIQFYTKKSASGKTIKVLALRREGAEIPRPEWFTKQHREVRRHFPQESSGELISRTAGSVTNNAMAEAFAKLNPAQLFAAQSGSEHDEHDEHEDDSMYEAEGELPEEKEPEPVVVNEEEETPAIEPEPVKLSPEQQQTYNDLVEARIASKANKVASIPPAQPQPVSKAEVTQAADTLRLIADQLEAQAAVSEELRKKKERFDVLMRMARESSVQIQTALDNHNELLDDLQKAANDLTTL